MPSQSSKWETCTLTPHCPFFLLSHSLPEDAELGVTAGPLGQSLWALEVEWQFGNHCLSLLQRGAEAARHHLEGQQLWITLLSSPSLAFSLPWLLS